MPPPRTDRDRDPDGRARSARARDELGRPTSGPARVAIEPEAPAPAPEEALRRAQDLLDRGRAFAAHEVLEAVWKDTAGTERELWRGLAQVAVGITHALRGNETGARSLLLRGRQSLAPFASSAPHGVDVDGIRAWAAAASSDLALATGRAPRLVGDRTASGGERAGPGPLGD
jgi:uncharacterized protein